MKALLNGLILLSFLTPSFSYASDVGSRPESKLNAPEYQNFELGVMERLILAELALDRRNPGLALDLYLNLAEDTQDAAIAQRATDLSILFAGLDVALEPARIWAAAEQDNVQAQATVAAILLTQLKAKESLPYLAQLEAADPVNVSQHYQVIYDELKLPQEKEEVISALKMLIENTPDASGPYLTLSSIFLDKRDPETAFQYTEKALEHGFKDASLPILHAQALHQLQRQPDALLFLTDEARKTPENTELQLYLTEVLLRVWNDPMKAKEQLSLFMKGTPSSEEFLAGVILSIEYEWYSEAKNLLNVLRKDSKHEDTAEYFLGRVNEFEGNTDKALVWYEEVDRGQYQAIARLRMASLLKAENKLTEALDAISQARPRHPEDIKLLALLELEILTKLDRYDEAFIALSDTVAVLPFDSDILYIRALLAEKLNNLEIAESDLRRIIRIQPNHVEALNALGYILANRTERLTEAFSLINKALALSPNNPGILDSLGWAHFKKGNIEKAEEFLSAAWKLSQDPLIAAHYGEVLFSNGKADEANLIWASALKMAPSDEMLVEVVLRLMPERAHALLNSLDTQ